MEPKQNEETHQRNVALQNSESILLARQRAEQALLRAKEDLELKTEELARSLAITQATLESTTDGILVVDQDGHVLCFNRKFVEMWQIPPETMSPMSVDPIRNFLAQRLKDPPLLPGNIKKLQRSSSDLFDILALIDGRVFERFSRVQRIDAKMIGHVWSFRDITERQRAEEILARLAAVVESSDDAITSRSMDGVFRSWNRGAERIYGYTAEEVMGRPVAILIPPDRQDESPAIMARLERGERVESYETIRVRKDGTYLDVSVTISLIRDAEGKVTGASTIARDISERKRTERKLFESNQRLEALMNALPVGVTFSDDLTCERITGNPAALAQFKAKATENLSASSSDKNATGRNFIFLREGQPVEPAALPLQRAVAENREIPPMELEVIMPDGRNWFMLASGSPIRDSDGKVVSGVSVTVDITERKYIEEVLRRDAQTIAERQQELEQLVDERTGSLQEAITQMEEFSYSVSHDLRAPLRAMQGYAAVLLEDYGSKIDSDGREYLNRIISAGLRMDRLTRDVLTYSKIPRTSLRLDRVDLTRLITEIVRQFAPDDKSGAQVTVVSPFPDVIAYEPLLAQAISNLVDNALKFTSPDRPQHIRLRAEREGQKVRLWVEDNGIGIKEEHQQRIWGMFERVHHRDQFEGTGIGLAIVRKAVERMDGTIGVVSDGVTGSNFWILLPLAPAINN